MLTMQSFFTTTSLGLAIAPRSVTACALSRKRGTKNLRLLGSRTVPLPPGLVGEGFTSPVLDDRTNLTASLREVLREHAWERLRHAGLSLPDQFFRVQLLDFDELPDGHGDRERLVRWRMEKAAVVDMTGTVLRFQAARREDGGYTVLACIIKREVLAQYDDLLIELGLEPWNVRPASFHVLNLYAPSIAMRNITSYALVWLAESSANTLIVERGTVRFYRYREVKAGPPGDAAPRVIRELDDTLHFYQHMDRNQPSEVSHIFLAGDPLLITGMTDGLAAATALTVESITPSLVVAEPAPDGVVLDAALGAGGWL
jgi:Tfp pilus assembly PilM family ATPase